MSEPNDESNTAKGDSDGDKHPCFSYGSTEMEYLSSRDPVLGEVIERIGHIDRVVIPDLFSALVNSIVGQQISGKALDTIWRRMEERLAPLEAEHLARLDPADIQSCGMTMTKATRIVAVSRMIADGEFDLAALRMLPDEEVCARLVELPGIGRWTAEMLMIFSMQRSDILSFGDLGIQRGLRMVYHHRKVTPQMFERHRRSYSPYGSIASLYLWEVAGGAIPEMHDHAPKASSQKMKASRLKSLRP